jgi:VanZ family protein
MVRAQARSLSRLLALAYAFLVVYASLHPVGGWRDSGAPLLEFLSSPWPRYYTWLDIGLNLLAYLPLGLLLVPALQPRLKPGAALLAAWILGTALSFALEVMQNYLPSRVPSNLDLATNAAGTLLGGLLGLRYGRAFAEGGGLTRWRARRIVRGRLGDVGLVLVGVWLLAQVNPETLLFGSGDLRSLLDLEAPLEYSASRFFMVEQAIAVCGVIAAGLIFWRLMRETSPWLLAALFVAALLIKTLTAVLLVEPDQALHWVTPGNMVGLVIGSAALAASLSLPAQFQQTLAALALLAGTSLVNLAPENPYLLETLGRWYQGHFLNFNGLTRIASSVWPFAALAFLVSAGPPRASAHP